MRCNICNAVLSPPEVQWNSQHKDWDPCGRCLTAIDEVFNDRSEEEIDDEIDYLLFEEELEDALETLSPEEE